MSSPPRANEQQVLAHHGHLAGDGRAHAGGEERQLVPGQQVAAEAEGEEDHQQSDAGQPGELARPPVGPHDVGRQDVQEQDADQQVGAPGVDGAEEPAEIDFRHDGADAFEGLVGRGLVIQGEEDARDHLDDEQEQRHSAQEVEEAAAVHGDALLGGQRDRGVQPQSFEEEGADALVSSLASSRDASNVSGDNDLLLSGLSTALHGFVDLQRAGRRAGQRCGRSGRRRRYGNCRRCLLGRAVLDGTLHVGADGVKGPRLAVRRESADTACRRS